MVNDADKRFNITVLNKQRKRAYSLRNRTKQEEIINQPNWRALSILIPNNLFAK